MNTLIIIIVIIVWTVNHLLLHLKGYRIFDPPFAFHISWIPIAFTTFLLPEIFHIKYWMWLYLLIIDIIYVMLWVVMPIFPRNGKRLLVFDTLVVTKKRNILLFLALTGWFVNYVRAISVTGVIFPFQTKLRIWEYAFGENVITNYLYFCFIPSLQLSVFLYATKKSKKDFLVSLILFSLSFFHGIRGTIIYPLVISVFTYIFIRNNMGSNFNLAKLVSFGILWIVIIYFSFFLISVGRIGIENIADLNETIDHNNYLFWGYLGANYSNLQLVIENKYSQPNYAVIFQRMLKLVGLTRNIKMPDYPIVTPSFNLGTSLRDYVVDFGLTIGIIVNITFYFFVSYIWFLLANYFLSFKSEVRTMILAVLFTVNLMYFWYNELFRPQFWFAIVCVMFPWEKFLKFNYLPNVK